MNNLIDMIYHVVVCVTDAERHDMIEMIGRVVEHRLKGEIAEWVHKKGSIQN